MNDRAFQQSLTHHVQQRLKVLAALDDPACQCLSRNFDAMPPQHTFETVQRQTIDVLDGQQHGQFRIFDGQQRLALCLVVHRQLRGIRIDALLGLATKEAVAQQLDLLFEIHDVDLMSFYYGFCLFLVRQRLKQQLLAQNRIIGKVGHGNHAADFTGPGTETRC